MPSREERLAANEARFRDINQSAQPRRESQGTGRFICECADRSCTTWITVPPEVYAAVRADSHKFIVAPGHETPDIESVIERCDGYFVIAKPDSVEHIIGQEQPT